MRPPGGALDAVGMIACAVNVPLYQTAARGRFATSTPYAGSVIAIHLNIHCSLQTKTTASTALPIPDHMATNHLSAQVQITTYDDKCGSVRPGPVGPPIQV